MDTNFSNATGRLTEDHIDTAIARASAIPVITGKMDRDFSNANANIPDSRINNTIARTSQIPSVGGKMDTDFSNATGRLTEDHIDTAIARTSQIPSVSGKLDINLGNAATGARLGEDHIDTNITRDTELAAVRTALETSIGTKLDTSGFTGAAVVALLQALTADARLDASAIRNLPTGGGGGSYTPGPVRMQDFTLTGTSRSRGISGVFKNNPVDPCDGIVDNQRRSRFNGTIQVPLEGDISANARGQRQPHLHAGHAQPDTIG